MTPLMGEHHRIYSSGMPPLQNDFRLFLCLAWPRETTKRVTKAPGTKKSFLNLLRIVFVSVFVDPYLLKLLTGLRAIEEVCFHLARPPYLPGTISLEQFQENVIIQLPVAE